MKAKEIYSDRRFLNKGSYHSIAAVCGVLSKDIEEDDYSWTPFNTEFYISNCDRSIILDIDCSTEEDFDNSIYKLQQIEEVCRGLKEALIEQKPVLVEWIKNKKERWKVKYAKLVEKTKKFLNMEKILNIKTLYNLNARSALKTTLV